MHKDFWHSGDGFCDSCGQKNIPSQKYERDSVLIIALLLILISDGGDEMLIMALLYILS